LTAASCRSARRCYNCSDLIWRGTAPALPLLGTAWTLLSLPLFEQSAPWSSCLRAYPWHPYGMYIYAYQRSMKDNWFFWPLHSVPFTFQFNMLSACYARDLHSQEGVHKEETKAGEIEFVKIHPQDKTWAAPSEVVWPTRLRHARRCSACTTRHCIDPNRLLYL